MPVSLVEPAVYRGAFDLEALKARLGIVGSAKDSELSTIAEEVVSAAEAYLGRPLARQRYREELEGASRFGRLVLCLTRYPVDPDSVIVEVEGDEVTDFEVRDWPNGELWRADGWPMIRRDGDGAIGVSVEYAAGYVMPEALVSWVAEAEVEVGQWWRPPAAARSALLFEVTEEGTLGELPDLIEDFPTTAGAAIVHDGAAEAHGAAGARPAGRVVGRAVRRDSSAVEAAPVRPWARVRVRGGLLRDVLA
ncbi:MAG: hypothetical protein IPQ07_39945 [Myxococcales bacterium]|nr:hypothetical protein [Myxococcales bacterium]